MNAALRLLFRLVAPAGAGSRLTVMIFHRVLREPDPLLPVEPDAQAFEGMMRDIRAWFTVLPLSDAIDRLHMGTLPERPLAITFDDGYANNAEVAVPVLQKLGLTATFFVATGFLNGGRMWNDTLIEMVRRHEDAELDLSALGLGRHEARTVEQKLRTIDVLLDRLKYLDDPRRTDLATALAETSESPLPSDLMMTSAQLRDLHRAGMTVAAHTVSHPVLSGLDEARARAEIYESKIALENITGSPVTLFAYPNGRPGQDYSAAHVAMVKELGFKGAVSTAWGTARPGCDLFQLPRFTPWGRTSARYALRFAQNLVRSHHRTV